MFFRGRVTMKKECGAEVGIGWSTKKIIDLKMCEPIVHFVPAYIGGDKVQFKNKINIRRVI